MPMQAFAKNGWRFKSFKKVSYWRLLNKRYSHISCILLWASLIGSDIKKGLLMEPFYFA